MNREYDVVALGELLIDFTNNGLSDQANPLFEANPGGAPCNVLAMLGKFGHKTSFIGKVGDDMFGHLLTEAIEEVGIDSCGLVYDKDIHTTLAFVHTSADGDRNFSFYRNPGADIMLKPEEVDPQLIKSSKIFHFGTLSLTDEPSASATIKALDIASENGLIISFDPNLRPPLWDSMERAKEKMAYGMSRCDILKISDNEIQFFTGEEDIVKGVEKIRSQFDIKLICATLGRDGSIAFYDDMIIKAAPYLTEKTIETTGAGDTFMGCVLHQVLKCGLNEMTKQNLEEMLDVANRAASDITTRKGALRVMPEVENL